MKKIIFVMLLLVIAYACQDDDLTNEPNSENPIEQNDALFQQDNFGASTPRNFIGRVVDAQGQRINGAQVTIGNAITTTDHNGIFVINNASVYEKFAYVKATKSGYLTGSKAIVPTSNGSNEIVITLLEKNVVATISSGEETVVNYEGSQIIFPGDFVDANGNPYSGQVEVSIHYLAPNRSETFAQMPGMLFGQTEANTAVSMETYGMLGVELLSASGESLSLAEGSSAIVEFPIAEEQLGIAPNAMNLWHFDEDQGYWKEEGFATRVGDVYVAEVAHFSWWNCDLPLDYVTVCFSLTSTDGIDLSGYYVEIIRDQTNQTIFAGYTNVEGQECGLFPADEVVTINIYGTEECQGEIIHTEQVGPFSSDTDFTVNVPLQNVETTTIMATVNNCNGEPLVNGYAFLYDVTAQNMFNESQVISISNGIINYDMSYCEGNTSYNLIIYDLDTNQNTGVIEAIELASPITSLETLTTCEQTNAIFEGNVILETQEDVNSFGLLGYTEINGLLQIGYDHFSENFSDINDLSALNTLNSVDYLFISRNPQLFSLGGLNSIQSVQSLSLYYNLNLHSIEDLSSLSGDINVIKIFTSAIQSLDGLQNVTSIGNLRIVENYFTGQTLEGMDSMISINEVGLLNTSLISIEDLAGIEITNISIEGNNSLESLNGLESLTNIEELKIIENNSLQSLSGLENLTNIGSLWLSNNEYLTSITELSNATITNTVLMNSNTLISLEGLNLSNQIENVAFTGSFITSLDILSSYTSLSFLRISETNLTSLEGLNNLESINDLRLYENHNLTNLIGLDNVQSIDDFIISECDSLLSLEGLNNLTSLGDAMVINNDNLISLEGLGNLLSVERLGLGENHLNSDFPNPQLSDFCALQNLFTNGTYNPDEVRIGNNAYNPSIQDIIDGNCAQ